MAFYPAFSLNSQDTDRIIEMAWEDRTPFDAIEHQFGLSEGQVIELMRRELKANSWRRWRRRVSGRSTKHEAFRVEDKNRRFRCSRQKAISHNRIT